MTPRWSTTAVSLAAVALLMVVPCAAAGTDSTGSTTVGVDPPPSTRATTSDWIGFSTSTVWLSPVDAYAYLSRLRAGGVRWIREDFTWSEIEPSRGRFVWRHTDNLMRNAALLGIRVLALATYAPGWASGHYGTNKYPPKNPVDYARFVRSIADRYGSRGTFWRLNPRLAPSPITAIELWNEPWMASFWEPAPDPAAYARLVRAAAVAVKARHPGLSLLASADLNDQNPSWFTSMLAADPPLWQSSLVSAWSVHPYCHDQSPSAHTLPLLESFDRVLLTRSLAQQAGADKPIWITEFGWRTDQGGPDAVSEDAQAQFTRDALIRIRTQWGSFVRKAFLFTWTKPSLEDQYNLIRPDGSTRPAWLTVQRMIATGT